MSEKMTKEKLEEKIKNLEYELSRTTSRIHVLQNAIRYYCVGEELSIEAKEEIKEAIL